MSINKYIIGIAILVVVLIVGISARNILADKTTNNQDEQITTQNQNSAQSGNNKLEENEKNEPTKPAEQTATLIVEGGTYILSPSTLKKDVPIRITADVSKIPGCAKAITIPEYDVLKYVSAKDNVITFTPTKAGTFKIACTMNMYTGTFTVE